MPDRLCPGRSCPSFPQSGLRPSGRASRSWARASCSCAAPSSRRPSSSLPPRGSRTSCESACRRACSRRAPDTRAYSHSRRRYATNNSGSGERRFLRRAFGKMTSADSRLTSVESAARPGGSIRRGRMLWQLYARQRRTPNDYSCHACRALRHAASPKINCAFVSAQRRSSATATNTSRPRRISLTSCLMWSSKKSAETPIAAAASSGTRSVTRGTFMRLPKALT